MDLYGYWRSAATYRVRVALNLKGIGVHEIPIDLDKGEQDAPYFRAINPQGAVPALVEPGLPPLTQSLALLEYLEELHPHPALLPADPRGRARVRSLAAGIAADSHPLIVPRVRNYLMQREGFDATRWKAWQTQWFGEGLRTLEARLTTEPGTGKFCHGDMPTFADLCLMSCVIGVRVFKLDIGPTPTVDRIATACDELEAFARAHPKLQAGAPT
ncbi:maleylacetoacetate isomerase [Acidisphaera sp. L21]|uniref:maleylacetoacetate isomerase n=1 Tax=Acidisphaera sp. L21 TaxID=1641851 RepID=UPI00131DFC5D|nr:maleylacetoacetate isomerase [Acidisphaera sp. L21]